MVSIPDDVNGDYSASNRNEYQEYFLGGGWGLVHLHVPNVLNSESLNLLEPSGPVQACNGIALPLPFTYNYYITKFVFEVILVMCQELFRTTIPQHVTAKFASKSVTPRNQFKRPVQW